MAANQADDAGLKWGARSDQYEKIVHQQSLLAAQTLIDRASALLPFDDSSSVFDNGSGTGSVTLTLHDTYPSISITATDISPGMIKILSAKAIPNVQTQVADACDLKVFDNGVFSHVFCTFTIQFTPSADLAVREMRRVLQPSGLLGLGTWKSYDFAKIVAEASHELDPSIKLPATFGTQWPYEEAEVKTRLESLGFKEVEERTIRLKNQTSNEDLVAFVFGLGDPSQTVFLKPWIDDGRIDELREGCEKVISGEKWKDRRIGMEAIIAIARKV